MRDLLARAIGLHRGGRSAEAIPLLERAARLQPELAEVHRWHCLAQLACGRRAAALASGQRALSLEPSNPRILNLVGSLYQAQGDWLAAEQCHRRAVTIEPDFADAQHNLGIALHMLGRPAEAVPAYRTALACGPEVPHLHYNLALSLQAAGRYGDAVPHLVRALALEPTQLEAACRLRYIRRALCDWTELARDAADLEQVVLQHLDRGGTAVSPYELTVLGVSPACHHRAAAYYSRRVAARAAATGGPPHIHQRTRAEGALRLGYLSADFCAHAVGGLVFDLLRHHDRHRVRVYAYSLRDSDDEFQQAVRSGADVFRDLSSQTVHGAAEQIAADGIDVLIDLGGYTLHARPEILALRPAPLQISWLGYLNTMAADFIDYLIVDAVVAPPGDESLYREALLRLPGSFMPASPLPAAPDTPGREDLGLPARGVVFASFNSPYKIDPEAFGAWMAILRAVPDSVLWIYAELDESRANLAREAEQRGVEPRRLVFAGRRPMREHMARMRRADLFLDTFGYNAGASAIAALSAGLPLLTRTGDTLLARMGTSFNRTLGLEELIASSLEEYRDIAIGIARAPERLSGLKRRLADARGASALFDLARFAAHLEQGLLRAWANHCAGRTPTAIDVAESR